MAFLKRIADSFRYQGTLAQIIIINIVIFLVVNITINVTKGNIDLTNYLGMPVIPEKFLVKFWTLFTHMFTHEGLGHIFWNMIWFYFYCSIFYILFDGKKLLYVYIMSGVCGALLVSLTSMIFNNPFGDNTMYGASAAILGVGGVMLIYAPGYRINVFGLIELPFKYIYLFAFVTGTIIDLAVNTGGKIGHLGGGLFGILYGYQLRRGRNLADLSFFKFKPKKKKSNLKVVSKNPNIKQGGSSPREDAAMNELLDKISKSGYDSLTKAEKELLFKLSQKK